MGQFKPMVKMETTEPSVILKLKKGGVVRMKKGGSTSKAKKMAMGGGALGALAGTPALVGRPAVNAPISAPGKPSMAMRRKAMMARPMPAKPAMAPSGMPPMKEGGKADMAQDKAMIKKAFKQHDSQEHKSGKGTKLSLKKGGKSKFATGGAVVSESSSGSYNTTKMHTAKADNSPANTGEVKKGNAGGFKRGGKAKKMATGGVVKGQAGYATGGQIPSESTTGTPATTIVDTARPDRSNAQTGGVRLGNAGGFKSGGKSSKKAYATGGIVDSGRPVAMPQGNKKPSSPVSIDRLSGTFKKGGKVTSAEGRLQKNFANENSTAMKEAKAYSNEFYSRYGGKKASGGRMC